MLDDGLIGLEVLKLIKTAKEIHTKVLNSGTLKNKKGVNVPGVSVNLPAITEKDDQILFLELNKVLILLLLHLFAVHLMFWKFVNYYKKIMAVKLKLSLKLKIKKA